MTFSRRKFLGSAASAAVTAISLPQPASAASEVGDVVGKITVGYQGWFACTGDGSPINGWWHWAPNLSQSPSPSNKGITAWPDMRDYPNSFATAFANLGNGSPAALFSSYDQATINTQFFWMQQNGCDTVALQRFNPTGGEGPTRDAIATRVRTAAETFGRKFYIMYDVTDWTNMQPEIKADWTNKMEALVASPAYARQNGRPVVGIWGFGFAPDNGVEHHPWPAAVCLDVINWFKARGCYVMGGVPTHWRTETGDSKAGFLGVYHAFNMISPWMVGRISNIADADNFYANVNQPDQADCNSFGIDYQPCILPGDLNRRQRAHGDFMWRQFYNMKRLGAQGFYISMFDEYNEGNQIAKTAETPSFVPTNAGMLALNEDGTACSANYYLRLTADGGRMLKGQLALTATRPTPPVVSGGNNRPGQIVCLLVQGNRRYVTAENAGAAPLVGNRSVIGGWEQFDLLDAGNGNVALRARANGLIVTVDGAASSALIARQSSIGPREIFRIVSNANGTISLQATASSLYVTTESAGASALTASRSTIGVWEQFRLVTG